MPVARAGQVPLSAGSSSAVVGSATLDGFTTAGAVSGQNAADWSTYQYNTNYRIENNEWGIPQNGQGSSTIFLESLNGAQAFGWAWNVYNGTGVVIYPEVGYGVVSERERSWGGNPTIPEYQPARDDHRQLQHHRPALAEYAVAHDALLCVQTGALLADTNRFKFDGTEHYLKSASEMRHLFRDVPEACDNTLLIAERADVQIELGKPSLPEFPVPDRFTGDTYEERALAYLRDLTMEGARERYGDPVPSQVLERIDFELTVIGDMGFPAYFLVVWDLIRFARENGIRVGPGRGSAAGCCVAYCLRIVDLDPIRYDLLFERFLNPGRKQMPDIDMDFDERYRADVMRYASEKYGSDRVAQIITFSTIKARAAVRDAARVLGKPYIVGDKIAKAMPPLDHGPGHAAARLPDQDRGSRGRLRQRRRAPRHARDGSRGQGGHRRRARPRGTAATGRNPRRRRRDLARPADRIPADPAQAGRRREAGGRADRHAVRNARRRGAGPAEDGLPRACATSR